MNLPDSLRSENVATSKGHSPKHSTVLVASTNAMHVRYCTDCGALFVQHNGEDFSSWWYYPHVLSTIEVN